MPRLTQYDKVLSYLQKHYSDTASNIATVLDIHEASVRRLIQEIIADGHNVTYANGSGVYTYSKGF